LLTGTPPCKQGPPIETRGRNPLPTSIRFAPHLGCWLAHVIPSSLVSAQRYTEPWHRAGVTGPFKTCPGRGKAGPALGVKKKPRTGQAHSTQRRSRMFQKKPHVNERVHWPSGPPWIQENPDRLATWRRCLVLVELTMIASLSIGRDTTPSRNGTPAPVKVAMSRATWGGAIQEGAEACIACDEPRNHEPNSKQKAPRRYKKDPAGHRACEIGESEGRRAHFHGYTRKKP